MVTPVEKTSHKSDFSQRSRDDVVFEGFLLKRGEHIRNWRMRYIILFNDGLLLGYKNEVKTFENPLNVFTVRDVQVMKVERRWHPNMFIVRGLQWTNVIERTFRAETPDLRDKWIKAIKEVSESLQSQTKENEPEAMSVNQLPMDIRAPPDEDTISRTTVADAGAKQEEELKLAGDDVRSEGGPSTSTTMEFPMAESPNSNIPSSSVITLDHFEFMIMLGKGTFGKVILCREKRTAKLYAIKILKKQVLINKEEVNHTYTENRVLQRCRHPFLTKMIYTFQTEHRLCFVMEFSNGGDLYYHLNKEVKCHNRGFTEDRTRFYGAEIVLALGYLHDNNIVYRDLKLENLMLDKEGHVKVADFGLCKEGISYYDRTGTFCGTPEYLAPEVLEDSDYGRCVDWWGLGVVMYEMICGRLPFFSRDHERLFQLIMQGHLRFPRDISENAKEILAGLLVKEPGNRLGGSPQDSREVMGQPFFETIDWERLYLREIEPPFVPQLINDADTSYFDVEFTRQPVLLTPPNESELDVAEMQQNFVHFQFHNTVNSHIVENSERPFDDVEMTDLTQVDPK